MFCAAVAVPRWPKDRRASHRRRLLAPEVLEDAAGCFRHIPLSIPRTPGRDRCGQAIIDANADPSPGTDNIDFDIPASTAPLLNVPVPGFDPGTQDWTITLNSPLPRSPVRFRSMDIRRRIPAEPIRYPDSISSAIQTLSILGSPTGGTFTLDHVRAAAGRHDGADPLHRRRRHGPERAGGDHRGWQRRRHRGTVAQRQSEHYVSGRLRRGSDSGPDRDQQLDRWNQPERRRRHVDHWGSRRHPDADLVGAEHDRGASTATMPRSASSSTAANIASGPADIGFEINASNSILRGLAIEGFNVGVVGPQSHRRRRPDPGQLHRRVFAYPVDPQTGMPCPRPTVELVGLGNTQQGVVLGSANTTVGGTDPQDNNVIAGNGSQGVLIEPGASGNQVLGNQIGVVGPIERRITSRPATAREGC